jgi:hypothetical protein
MCRYAAVGSGSRYAVPLLRKLFDWKATISLKKLAVFAVSAAKRQDQSCGGKTVLVCVTGNFFDRTSDEQIERWEKAFAKYQKTEAEVLRYLLGLEDEETKPQDALKDIASQLKSLRALLEK